MTQFLTIIQARMGSTRLPDKVLRNLCGKPFLAHCIARATATEIPTHVVVATTTQPEDDAIAALCRTLSIDCFRGHATDVLDRFWQCAQTYPNYPYIVRVTADDPFKDPHVIDRAMRIVLDDTQLDYVSNTIQPTYPEGIDIEVFTRAALQRAWQEATTASDREHVTAYIWNRPQQFHLQNFAYEKNLNHLRWTVDHPEDFILAEKVYAALYQEGRMFYLQDILDFLATHPELTQLNNQYERNESYNKSRQAGRPHATNHGS